MYQTFEDDLFYDEAEGPALPRYTSQAYDEFDDGFEDDFDLMGGYADSYDAYDDINAFDLMEEGIVDALEVEDTDEFLRRLGRLARRAVRTAGRAVRTAGRVGGQVARVAGPIASSIPFPATQAVGRVASIAGRLLADGADELDALDQLIDMADDEYFIDAAAPTMAGLAIHGTMPQTAARLPQTVRRQLVQATTETARALAQQQGPQAVRALPGVIQTTKQVARRQGATARQLPQIMQQVGNRIARNPALLRRMMQANPALRQSICAACAGTGTRRPMMR